MAVNYYGPLYNSIQAQGKLLGLGPAGALMPKDKKPGLGSKMASAIGSMMDQASESNVAQRKEQMAQLEGEYGRLEKFLSNGRFETVQNGPERKEVWKWNKDYKGDKSKTPDPDDWNKFYATKGQLAELQGIKKYEDRKPSVFDYKFTDTAKNQDTGFFGSFANIMNQGEK